MATNPPSPQQIEELVNNIAFFREIPRELLIETISYVSLRKYPCSQSILFDNHCDGSIYFIADGWIKVCISDERRKNNLYRLYGVGEIIGAIAAVEENWRPIEAVTLTSAMVWSIRSKDFSRLLKRYPQSGIQVAIFISKRLRKLNQYFRLQEAESTVKIANLLLELVGSRVSPQKQRVLIPNLPHREIAAISGITRETASRSLTKLEKRGLIRRQGATIEILQLELLQNLVTAELK
ncbi:MAG: Crp/Fnr family transcriptional regulator [Synechocystis sp.]|nr:Crp/Fnr family transcriptional regulator [Synechocystis sp.]